MKLSIIVACYNIDRYIRRCIESILPQLTKEVELVIINDGSTDDSKAILQSLASTTGNFKILNFNNGGLATARNRGIDNTTGEYLWFIDGDDFIMKDSVETLLKVIERTQSDIIAFNHYDNTNNGLILKSFYSTYEYNIYDFLKNRNKHFAWDKIYKRNLFSKVRFVDGLRNIEDFVFNLSVSPAVNKVTTIDQPLYVYECTNGSSISRDRSSRHLIQLTRETFKAHDVLLENFRNIEMIPQLRNVWEDQLATSFAGHIFSLLRFYNCRFVRRAISQYKTMGVYPFHYSGNYRQIIFTFFINNPCLWPIHKIVSFAIK